jgi:serine/threonine protein kinase
LYTPPEAVQKKASDLMAGDVWALGVVFAVMITGKSPWKCECMGELKQLTAHGTLTFKRPVPPEIEDLIRQMIVVRPSGRLTMAQIAKFPLLAGNVGHSIAKIGRAATTGWGVIRRSKVARDEEPDGDRRWSKSFTQGRVMCAAIPDGRLLRKPSPVKERIHVRSSTSTFAGFPDEVDEVFAADAPG